MLVGRATERTLIHAVLACVTAALEAPSLADRPSSQDAGQQVQVRVSCGESLDGCAVSYGRKSCGTRRTVVARCVDV